MKSKLILLFLLMSLYACKPLSWTTASQEEGLVVKTSWEELSKPAENGAEMRLQIWVMNEGSSPVEYDLGVEFFLNGKQIENAPASRLCAKPGISYKGKLSGTYFEPVGISAQQVKDSLITVELLPLNVEKVSECPKE